MARVIQIGSDKVILDGYRIIIDASRPIHDWSVREFCQHPIYFEGWKYRLVSRRRVAKPYAVRYELHAWPEDLHESSTVSFTYDADFVAARDSGARMDQARTLLWYAMLPLYPLLGLCWSGFKERVLWPIGFVPAPITGASVMFLFCFTVCDAIFYGYLGGGIMIRLFGVGAFGGWTVLLDLFLIGLLALDTALRFGQSFLNDDPVPDGFLEWLFRPLINRLRRRA